MSARRNRNARGTERGEGRSPGEREGGEFSLLDLAPAAEHLLGALGEITAAAQVAMESLPPELRIRHRETLRSGKALLALVGSLAESGAIKARARMRSEARREALAEILEAIDQRAARLDGAAADALASVRDAIAAAAGHPGQRPGEPARAEDPPPPQRTRPAGARHAGSRAAARAAAKRNIRRELKRIPISSEDE